MDTKGIIPVDDGMFKQAKAEKKAPMLWLTDQVIGKLSTDGKDWHGKDFNVREDLEKHIGRFEKAVGFRDDDAPGRQIQKSVIRRAALETYGIATELEARGIRPEFDTGEKFFGPGAENSPLFPPLLASTFIMSRISAGLVDQMVFADVTVDRLSVDKVRLNELADDRQLRNVGLGDPLPITELSHVDTNVKMRKYGRLFRYAREVVRMQPLAVVQGFVSQMARQIAVDETDETLEILHAGDGETGSAVTDTTPATDGTLAYGDLITLEMVFANGYAGRTFLADSASFLTVLQMSEYKDPLANRGVAIERNIPNVPTPSGMGRIWRWSSTGSTYMAEASGRIAAVDPTMACYVARTALLEQQAEIIESGREAVALSYLMAVVKGDPSCFASLDVLA